VRISDLFEGAPNEVGYALAVILLSKLYRKKIDSSVHRTYRAFILRNEVQEQARVARNDRGRGARISHARGRYFDLESLFDRINVAYFCGALPKPKLSWSVKKSRYILGRYDATHGTIFISRILDSEKVPAYVIEYVLYHEMLHVKHQTRVRDCRLIVHTEEFKQEERRFAQFKEAKEWLKTI
jgi:predicted metal-dependent hydrolase